VAAPITCHARVDSDGTITQLGTRPVPDEVVTAEDAKDPEKVAKILARLLAGMAEQKRRWAPRRMDFAGVVVAVGSYTTLQHNFAGAVHWWIINWQSTGAGNATQFIDTDFSDDNSLVLFSGESGIATIRVEAAG
jgi:hypothetical protein